MKLKLIDITEKPEVIIESAARVCYQSKIKKLSIKKTFLKKYFFDYYNKKYPNAFLRNLIKRGHMVPFEHAKATFLIESVSRNLSHQLVRHRLSSFCQLSQRYVDMTNFDYVIPETIKKDEMISDFINDMEIMKEMYSKWSKRIPKEDARYVLPSACTTSLYITSNFRQFRSIFKLRSDKHAQWEIRNLSDEMLKILYKKSPNTFYDLYSQYILKD